MGDHIVVMLCHTSPTYSVCLITIPGEIDFQLDSEQTTWVHTHLHLRCLSCYRDGHLHEHTEGAPQFVLLPRRAPT